MFYFGAFEGQYRNTEGESIYTVPTEKMRARRFQRGAQHQRLAAVDLRSAHRRHRGPRARRRLPNNIIPADRINAIARRINEFYPLPNGPGNPDNYFKEYISTFDRNQYRREDQLEPQPRPSDLGKDRRHGRDREQPPEAVVRRRRPRKDDDLGGDDRSDVHAEPIARHRHHRRLLAPRSVGVRSRLRDQLRIAARRPRHQRPGHPPERHAGLGEWHERAGLDRQLESVHAVRSRPTRPPRTSRSSPGRIRSGSAGRSITSR